MPTKPTTIRIDDTMAAVIEPRKPVHHDSVTATLSAILSRYALVCQRDIPAFSEPELNLIRDALNGVWMREGWTLTSIWAEVADHIELNGAAKQHGVKDPQGLVRRVRALTAGQTVALVDDVERWWKAAGSARAEINLAREQVAAGEAEPLAVAEARAILGEQVTSLPNVCHGKPCVRGTRVIVAILREELEAGSTIEEVAQEYEAPLETVRALDVVRRWEASRPTWQT